ncbi:MAG TPA: pyrophosphatase PpaX [Firmicutes bacterium]|nr:pyrophosphatase PpaX [Bacillota bacterium]
MIKAVFFDLDGTLIDTNQLIINSFYHTFQTYFPERQFLETDILDCIGPTLAQTFSKYNEEAVHEMIQTYREFNMKHHDEMVVIFPGVIEMLKQLHDMGLKLAIVTSKKRDIAIHGAQLTKIYDYFDYVISADEVTDPKPHPEAIEKTLAYFDLAPADVIMVGDNSHDIECAHRAGVKSVGVGWSLRGAEYLKTYRPSYIIKTGQELVDIVKELNHK